MWKLCTQGSYKNSPGSENTSVFNLYTTLSSHDFSRRNGLHIKCNSTDFREGISYKETQFVMEETVYVKILPMSEHNYVIVDK